MEPLFLTHKLAVSSLWSLYNVYDFQLRDHLLTNDDLYLSLCDCFHTHSKQRCKLVSCAICEKCKTPNERYINYRSLLFHQDAANNRLARCCKHWHAPPCGVCIGCRTTSTCIVQLPFECDYSTEATCNNAGKDDTHFTKQLVHADLVHEHIYNTRYPQIYFCSHHTHVHKHEHEPHSQLDCNVQAQKCCENSVLVTDFDSSFLITLTTKKEKPNKTVAKTFSNRMRKHKRKSTVSYSDTEFVIFDPRIWREQSRNHFFSMVRALVNIPELVAERYQRFVNSSFKVSNIKKYKSGKQSIVRTAITGFETKGMYQTATISCTLPGNNVILIPQKIYDLMENSYDMSLVAVKRDPSIKQTSMFVCRAKRNQDPNIDTLVIPDVIASPLHQDQDGDKNGVYVLPITFTGGFNRLESFLHRLARLELAVAYYSDQTLIAAPRYSLSENTRLILFRKRDDLIGKSEFFKRTYKKGVNHMLENGCGYLRAEYSDFCRVLLDINTENEKFCITLDDISQKTNIIPSIVESGAKGHKETLDMLYKNLNSNLTFFDLKNKMIDQMNRYLSSSQQLRRTGRNQFVSLYAAHDLIVIMGLVYVNKQFYADYKPFSSAGVLMFNEGSLNEFIEDLKRA